MFFTPSRSSADALLLRLLLHLGINTNLEKVSQELSIHPDYPSLLAINDVLASFGVAADGYRIGQEELPDIPTPFIANLTQGKVPFVLVESVTADAVLLSKGFKRSQLVRRDDFAKEFSGVVLAVHAPDLTKKKPLSSVHLYDWKEIAAISFALLGLMTLIVMNAPFFHHAEWNAVCLAAIKLSGTVTSSFLLIYSINANNTFLQKLCGGKNRNCNSILSSDAANVFNGLSWSEVGFFYFSGTWLCLVFLGGQQGIGRLLSLMNLLALPYTVYSIYYQARIAKQWCILCCTVQGLLWLEFLTQFPYFNRSWVLPGYIHSIQFAILAGLPASFWVLLKPYILRFRKMESAGSQLRNFKYNLSLFKVLLEGQSRYSVPDEKDCIVLGNAEAGNVITIVSNPSCGPCAKTHLALDNWMKEQPDVQLRFVFTSRSKDNDLNAQVVRHLLSLNKSRDKILIQRALHAWFAQPKKDYIKWVREFPEYEAMNENSILDKQAAWCKFADIQVTPTILINGYRLPEFYKIEEIKYMLS
jgi:uncharacterized membrane protein/thiol-disulfide isomerase/thioredoxin